MAGFFESVQQQIQDDQPAAGLEDAERGVERALWAARTTGGAAWRLTEGQNGVLSPDGRYVAFARDGQIYRVPAGQAAARVTDVDKGVKPFDYAALRAIYGGPWMVNNGYSRAMALDAVASGAADLVAFGKPFISNPDLVRRLHDDLPLQPLVQATLYGGGAAGYTDYPALAAGQPGA